MTQKRGQNTGSVYKRKDGRMVAQVTVQGKPIYKYVKNRREGEKWIKEKQSQIDAGLSFMGTQITVKDYLQEWLKTIQSSVRPKTIEQYIQIVNQHITPAVGMIKLSDLRPDHVQSFYNAKLRNGASSRTVGLIHAVFHRALHQALKLGLIIRNPTDAVTRPKLQRMEMHAFDDSQARNLLLTARGSRIEVLLNLAISTGLREGELLGLKWGDLDWNARKLHIQRQAHRIKFEGLVFSPPKTNAGRRAITLGKGMIDKLREQAKIVKTMREFAGDRWEENDLIFPNVHGKIQDPANLLKIFKELLVEAGLPEIRFHDLRHTAATLMLQQGIHPKVVQERLGHSDISLTLNTYSHVLPSMQEEAAEKMDELLTPIDISNEIGSFIKKS